jgi:hypothetical protein
MTGFSPNENVTITAHSTPIVLGTFQADANGVIDATVTLPSGLELGSHQLIVAGVSSGHTVTLPMTLTSGTASTLASTGTDLSKPIYLMVQSLLTGFGLLFLAARRRRLLAD